MTKYDILTRCPICGQGVTWRNGSTNNGLVYIKTKRKSVLVIHETYIQKEELQNGHNKSEKEH